MMFLSVGAKGVPEIQDRGFLGGAAGLLARLRLVRPPSGCIDVMRARNRRLVILFPFPVRTWLPLRLNCDIAAPPPLERPLGWPGKSAWFCEALLRLQRAVDSKGVLKLPALQGKLTISIAKAQGGLAMCLCGSSNFLVLGIIPAGRGWEKENRKCCVCHRTQATAALRRLAEHRSAGLSRQSSRAWLDWAVEGCCSGLVPGFRPVTKLRRPGVHEQFIPPKTGLFC